MGNRIVSRGWIYFSQICGTILSLFVLAFYIYSISGQEIKWISNDGTEMTYGSYALISVILGVLVYFAWKSLYSAIVIIKFVSKNDDIEIISNKYILSCLSLTVGGFFTPFILTSLPNLGTRSTINPRIFLSKTFGKTMLVGGILALVSYIAFMLFKVQVDFKDLFNGIDQEMVKISKIFIGVCSSFALFGMLLIIAFHNHETFAQEKTERLILKVLSSIVLVIITIELIIIALMALIRLLGGISDLVKSASDRNAFGVIFSMINLLFTFMYVTALWGIIYSTIGGLWSTEQIVEYKKSEKIEYMDAKRRENLNNN